MNKSISKELLKDIVDLRTHLDQLDEIMETYDNTTIPRNLAINNTTSSLRYCYKGAHSLSRIIRSKIEHIVGNDIPTLFSLTDLFDKLEIELIKGFYVLRYVSTQNHIIDLYDIQIENHRLCDIQKAINIMGYMRHGIKINTKALDILKPIINANPDLYDIFLDSITEYGFEKIRENENEIIYKKSRYNLRKDMYLTIIYGENVKIKDMSLWIPGNIVNIIKL